MKGGRLRVGGTLQWKAVQMKQEQLFSALEDHTLLSFHNISSCSDHSCIPCFLSGLAVASGPQGSRNHCHFLLRDYAHLDSSCIFAGMWVLRSVQPYAVGLGNGSHSKQVKWFLAQCLRCVETSKPILCF